MKKAGFLQQIEHKKAGFFQKIEHNKGGLSPTGTESRRDQEEGGGAGLS